MARKYYTYRKYEDNRKKTERFLNNMEKAGKKARSDRKKYARQKESVRNNRLREYERERKQREQAREKERAKNRNIPKEPMTFGEFMSGIGFMLAIVVMFILFFAIGFWKTILLGVGLFIAIIVILVIIDEAKEKQDTEIDQHLDAESEDRSNQIPYLKSLLSEIRKHQTIANTSNDPEEVRKHLDCLLGVMDEIATFDDATLKQAGMTKANYESAKAELLEVYDAMIAQAGECDDEDCTIESAAETSTP